MNDEIMTGKPQDIIQAAIKASGIRLGAITPVIEEFAGFKSTGYALHMGDEYFIFVDPNIPKAERDFVKAHELGHILLGHVNGSVSDKRDTEQEANIFASVLVAFNVALKMISEEGSRAVPSPAKENTV